MREVEGDDVDARKRVAPEPGLRPRSSGSRCRRGACARRARRCRRPRRRAGSASSAATGTSAAASDDAIAAGSLRRPSLPGRRSTAPSRADEHRVVDVDRVRIARVVARDDDLGAGRLEDPAQKLVLGGRGRVIRRRAPAVLAPALARPRRAAAARARARAVRSSTASRSAPSRGRYTAFGGVRPSSRTARSAETTSIPIASARLAGRARDVRREDDVLQREKLLAHGRLVLEDVERGAGDRPRSSAATSAASSTTCPRAVFTSTAVGFIAASASASMRCRVSRRQRAVQRDDVGARRSSAGRSSSAPGERRPRAVRGRELGDTAADPPRPDDEQSFPSRLSPTMKSGPHSQSSRRRSERSPSAMRRRSASVERDRVLGGRVRQHARRVA